MVNDEASTPAPGANPYDTPSDPVKQTSTIKSRLLILAFFAFFVAIVGFLIILYVKNSQPLIVKQDATRSLSLAPEIDFASLPTPFIFSVDYQDKVELYSLDPKTSTKTLLFEIQKPEKSRSSDYSENPRIMVSRNGIVAYSFSYSDNESSIHVWDGKNTRLVYTLDNRISDYSYGSDYSLSPNGNYLIIVERDVDQIPKVPTIDPDYYLNMDTVSRHTFYKLPLDGASSDPQVLFTHDVEDSVYDSSSWLSMKGWTNGQNPELILQMSTSGQLSGSVGDVYVLDENQKQLRLLHDSTTKFLSLDQNNNLLIETERNGGCCGRVTNGRMDTAHIIDLSSGAKTQIYNEEQHSTTGQNIIEQKYSVAQARVSPDSQLIAQNVYYEYIKCLAYYENSSACDSKKDTWGMPKLLITNQQGNDAIQLPGFLFVSWAHPEKLLLKKVRNDMGESLTYRDMQRKFDGLFLYDVGTKETKTIITIPFAQIWPVETLQ